MGNCGASNAGERPRVDKKSRPESPPKPTQQQAPKEKEPNAVLTAAQKQQLARETHFTLSEIDVLVSHYGYLSASMDDDGVIDHEEWSSAFKGGIQEAFTNLPHTLVDRMFNIFDGDGNGAIDLEEFIKGLSVFSKTGTLKEKAGFAFKLYDINKDGFITRDELYAIVVGSLKEANQKTDSSSVTLSQNKLDQMIDATFSEADLNNDGRIDFAEFEQMVVRHEDIVANINFRESILKGVKK